MRIGIQVIYPVGIEIRRTPDNPVHLISLLQQEFRQIRPVLAGDAGYQRLSHQTSNPETNG
jgi:hypothetical protein